MLRSLLKPSLYLLTSLTVWSKNSLAQELPKPDSLMSLTRGQKEKIAICFQENLACHDSLSRATSPPTFQGEWTDFIGVFVFGLVGGMVLENQIKH